MKCSVTTQKQPLSKVFACCRCSLPSRLLVGTGLLARWNCSNHYYFLVCCKCNRQHRWLDIAITNMYAGLVQVYQTCMLVGTSLQNDMTAGKMQLLKTWEMAGCNCYRHG